MMVATTGFLTEVSERNIVTPCFDSPVTYEETPDYNSALLKFKIPNSKLQTIPKRQFQIHKRVLFGILNFGPFLPAGRQGSLFTI